MDFLRKVKKEVDAVPNYQRSSTWISMFYIVFMIFATPYTFISEIIPVVFSYAGDSTVYWLNFLLVLGSLEVLTNYVCLQWYRSYAVGAQSTSGEIQDKLYRYGDIRNVPGYCSKCNLICPAGSKTHHCKVCKRCILRRDHHCFVLGTCIGYYNQRFFVVLAFYVGFGSSVTLYYIIKYLLLRISENPSFHWSDYFLPLTFVHWCQGEILLLEFLIVLQGYTYVFSAIIGIGFFAMQLAIISSGNTSREYLAQKNSPQIRSISKNFRLIFGRYWLLNFLVPMQLFFMPSSIEQPYTVPLSAYDSDFL